MVHYVHTREQVLKIWGKVAVQRSWHPSFTQSDGENEPGGLWIHVGLIDAFGSTMFASCSAQTRGVDCSSMTKICFPRFTANNERFPILRASWSYHVCLTSEARLYTIAATGARRFQVRVKFSLKLPCDLFVISLVSPQHRHLFFQQIPGHEFKNEFY